MSTSTQAAFAGDYAAAKDEIEKIKTRTDAQDSGKATTERLAKLANKAFDEMAKLEARVKASAGTAEEAAVASRDTRQLWRIAGRYRELADRVLLPPFRLEPIYDQDDGTQVIDFEILVRDGDKAIPEAVGRLKIEIDAALNVIKTVFADRRRFGPWLPYTNWVWQQRVAAAQTDYLKQVYGLACVGLGTSEPSRIAFARNDLLRLTNLFSLRETGQVKNAYVGRLAFCCGLAVVLFTGLYALSRSQVLGTYHETWLRDLSRTLNDFRNFHLLAAGTAIGTWLSFSLRRQELTFADLAVLEPDRLNPASRVAFMIGLSGLVGLLFFCGAVIAGVGTVTGQNALRTDGASALLIGLLAGVAERALGAAVSKRGLDFATLVGGDAGGTTAPAPKP